MLCHLLVYGIDRSYNPWLSHGESVEQIDKNKDQGYVAEVSDNESEDRPFDDMAPFVFDATSAWNSINSTSINENERTTYIGSSSGTSETPMLLQKLVEDMEADLYPGCKKFKILEFIMSLLHIKVSNKWSDKSFSMLLNALHRAFNYDNNLPSSSYDAKKYTKALGLDYVKIDACVNHCVLFRKEFANEVKCPKCSAPRWKQDISQDDENSDDEDEGVHRKTRVPQLVLRHFPLIPRLQRMFMCSKLAMHMRWHNKGHAGDDDDNIMRHPRDSKSWKSLDELYPEFAADARNVRLALASDGAMRTFKSFVRNKAHPEGSIAEGYIQKELLVFCARYLSKIETQFNRLDRNEDMNYPQLHSLSVFYNTGKTLGKPNLKQLSIEDWRKAQLYVLQNCEEAQPFFDEYENDIGHRDVEFCKWFENRIIQLWEDKDERVTEELLCLARGPMKRVVTFDGYVINGFRFHTKKRQRHRKTQNSGVVVLGDAESGGKDFYGTLDEVIVLEYDALENRTSPKVVLFRCKWFDVFSDERGIKKDKFGSTLVNVSRTLQTNESFALAFQIEQVFFISSHDERHWKYVIKVKPRNFFDFPNDEDAEQNEDLWNIVEEGATNLEEFTALSDEEINMVRDDVEPELVDAESREQRLTYREKRRLEQAEHRLKFPDRKRRGPTRGKKYVTKMWNPNSEEKIKINFMDELRRVVGEKADEFICDCSNWVKEFCPLKSLNWTKMDSGAKERLYKKIRAKYDLPDKVAGADVTDALSFQCSMLYKHWRFRLKEKYFRNKSIADAINSRPDNIDANQWTWLVCEYWNDEKQKRISKVNKDNKLKQTETPANGARSTARIFHELMNVQQTQGSQEHEGSSDNPLETQQDPLYITLFEKTKKHKDKGFEPNAEKDYEALRNLHEKEVKEHGEDTLSVKAAYMEVFKLKSGYVKGLGPGARPPKKRRVEGETNEVRVKLSAEIQQLKEYAATREGVLVSQIESLKESNEELRTSNEELIASNDELKATVSRINIEAQKREKKLRDDMMKMFEQLRYDTYSSSI
uniref:Uncharacterized protein n=1 Tax=Chenopodium quinoa TaxID=63459 RepID=A0A803N837_CHEQI